MIHASVQFSSVAQSCPTLCDPMNCTMPGFPVLPLSPGACSNSCPLSRWCHPTISSSVAPFSSSPQSFPASGSFPMSWLFASGGQSIRSFSFSISPYMNSQGWFPLDWLVWSPCCPGDSQKSSLAPQFKSINSSVLNLLYGQTLTSIHEYWKNHSFNYQTFDGNWCLCFLICCLGLS